MTSAFSVLSGSSSLPSPPPQGFRMPAEWEPHAATWTAWPRDDQYWGGALAGARQDFAQFLQALSKWELVHLLVHDQAALQNAQAMLGEAIAASRIQLHSIPQRDIWLRDSGPMFIKPVVKHDQQPESDPQQPTLQAINWEFNGWGDRFPSALDNQIPAAIAQILGLQSTELYSPGIIFEGGAIEVNGKGLGITTRQCLLATNRNPQLKEADLEQYLQAYLGIEQLIWLDQGLEGDHTDGHVDTITRFVGDRQVVTSVCSNPTDANYAPLQKNLTTLTSWRDGRGGLTVTPLPLPELTRYFDGERLPLTYANFYIANGVVLVPTFDCPQDEPALQLLQQVFPNREVMGLPALGLFQGGGGFHCATQQQPY